MIKRVILDPDGEGDIPARDFIRGFGASNDIIVGIFRFRDTSYLNVLHQLESGKFMWLNIANLFTRWDSALSEDILIRKYFGTNGTDREDDRLVKVFVMESLSDFSAFLHDYVLLASIGEEYK